MERHAHKSRSAKQANHQGAAKAAALPVSRRVLGLPRWAVILLTIALVAGVSFAAFEFLLPGRIPDELVGQWRVVGGAMDGTIFEFQRNGAMIGRKTQGEKEGRIEGTAEVTDKTLRTTTTNPFTGRAETGAQVIVTLTETEFVTDDGKGTRVTMTRLR